MRLSTHALCLGASFTVVFAILVVTHPSSSKALKSNQDADTSCWIAHPPWWIYPPDHSRSLVLNFRNLVIIPEIPIVICAPTSWLKKNGDLKVLLLTPNEIADPIATTAPKTHTCYHSLLNACLPLDTCVCQISESRWGDPAF